MLDDLKLLLEAHRSKQAFLTCDKSCFCWDIEDFISSHKQAGGTITHTPVNGVVTAENSQTVAYSFARLFAGENSRCG
jgi:hypothetical protein